MYNQSDGIFPETEKNGPNIWTAPQNTLKSQSNNDKEEQSCSLYTSCFQTILQSYSNKNNLLWH